MIFYELFQVSVNVLVDAHDSFCLNTFERIFSVFYICNIEYL